MSAIASFFAMGGYAVFVWPAFGVTALVMIGLLLASRHTLRLNEAALEALQRERRGAGGEDTVPPSTEPESEA